MYISVFLEMHGRKAKGLSHVEMTQSQKKSLSFFFTSGLESGVQV